MLSMDSGSSATKSLQNPSSAAAPPPPPEQEHLPCPRCDSTNTKFCYYNNYNYSQPRHFCKSCRRYWTHGGTLRDIPVGGGSRKNAKRSRTHHHNYTSASATSSPSSSTMTSASPLMVHHQVGSGSMQNNVSVNVSACGGGSFTSLLNNTATTQGSAAATSGFLALGGFGHHGFEDMGFGIGRVGWTFPGGMVENANIGGGGGGVAASGGGGSWQLDGGEGGFVGGDCFSWPGLAISTPGYGLK